jgi:hypothetical protein
MLIHSYNVFLDNNKKSVYFAPLHNKTINKDNSNNINKKNYMNNLFFFWERP